MTFTNTRDVAIDLENICDKFLHFEIHKYQTPLFNADDIEKYNFYNVMCFLLSFGNNDQEKTDRFLLENDSLSCKSMNEINNFVNIYKEFLELLNKEKLFN